MGVVVPPPHPRTGLISLARTSNLAYRGQVSDRPRADRRGGLARRGLQDLERFADTLAVNRFLASVQA